MGVIKKEDSSFYKAYYYVKSKDFLPKLSKSVKDVLLLINSLDNSEKHCWASNNYLAKNTGVDPATVCGAIKILEDQGLISREDTNDERILVSHLPKENSEQLILDHTSLREIGESLSNTSILNNNKKDYIELNRKNINLTFHPKAEIMLSKYGVKKQNIITDIYEFWNEFKFSGVWQSHRKLTPDMVTAIVDNLKSYTMDDMCIAIHNYAMVLQGDEYWWDYVWPLSAFFSVKDGKTKDAYKKWWRFLPENFVKENYMNKKQNGNTFYRRNNASQQDKLLDDSIPSFTKKLIKAHSRFTPRGWKPSIIEHNKFIQTTLRAQKQVDHIEESWIQDNLISDLLGALMAHYSDKGGVISPGHYCSDFTWDTLLYQFIVGQGVNPENLFNYTKGEDDCFDTIVAEEEELTKDIQKNMGRQNSESELKPVTEDTDEEFEYIKDI